MTLRAIVTETAPVAGRRRFNVGVAVAKRLRSAATALRTPFTNAAMPWKGHS